MDGNEFKRRFLSFSELIFRYSFTITGDSVEAEDIVQEVFEKLWKIRDSLSTVQSDEAYILSVTKHMALDHCRARTRKQMNALTAAHDPGDEGEGEKMIEEKEMVQHIENLLSTLPPSQQVAMRLRHFAGLPISRIAETMQQSELNVRQLLSRGRRTIKEKVEKLYEYERYK